jgi:hypothetical protein
MTGFALRLSASCLKPPGRLRALPAASCRLFLRRALRFEPAVISQRIGAYDRVRPAAFGILPQASGPSPGAVGGVLPPFPSARPSFRTRR